MKRRKKPLLLVTVLVVLLGAVIVMSMPPGGIAIKTPTDATGQGREAPSATADRPPRGGARGLPQQDEIVRRAELCAHDRQGHVDRLREPNVLRLEPIEEPDPGRYLPAGR